MVRKRFRELKVGDKIFFIVPPEDVTINTVCDIVESSVVDIHHSSLKYTTQLKFFRMMKKKAGGMIDEEALKRVYDQEGLEKVFLDMITDSKHSMVSLITKPPMVVATTAEELALFMKGG